MKKATKGALAAAAAGSLMLGGAGSLAYWTSTSDVTGANITSGHLKLASPTCAAWQLNSAAFDSANDKIKPGDTLTRACTYTIDMVGTGLSAKFKATVPALTGALAGALSTTGSTFTITHSGTPGTAVSAGTPTAVADTDTVTVNLEVKWTDGGDPLTNTGGDNAYNNAAGLAAALAATTVSVTQDH